VITSHRDGGTGGTGGAVSDGMGRAAGCVGRCWCVLELGAVLAACDANPLHRRNIPSLFEHPRNIALGSSPCVRRPSPICRAVQRRISNASTEIPPAAAVGADPRFDQPGHVSSGEDVMNSDLRETMGRRGGSASCARSLPFRWALVIRSGVYCRVQLSVRTTHALSSAMQAGRRCGADRTAKCQSARAWTLELLWPSFWPTASRGPCAA